MSFVNRSNSGKNGEEVVIHKFTQRGAKITHNGTEFGNADRFAPDLHVEIKDMTILVEAKNSQFVEKRCYERCMELAKENKVVFAFVRNGQMALIPVQELKFYDGDYENYMLPYDGIWRCPIKLNKNEYAYWKSNNPQASGTDFARVDLTGVEYKW